MTDTADVRANAYATDETIVRLQQAVGERYALKGRIGEGGMATVFLAEDTKHRRPVAIKVLQQSLAHTIGIRRFLQEIDVIARLQHPHLLTLIDSGDVGDLPYYVMPYLEAQSLRELITREKRLAVDQAVRITREVADGLQFAHANGVVHRDIKPSNVLMSGGHAVVADFGIATALEKAAVGRLTETGISLGSPTYMSPEQAAGERDLDERTDIYSLGCVLYELLTGDPPIDGGSMQEVVRRKLTGDIRRLTEQRRDVPQELAAVIERALATERVDRFESMRAFSDALAAAASGRPKHASRLVAAGVAAALLGVVLVGFWVRQERRKAWAARQIAEVSRLTVAGVFAGAFDLAERVAEVLPNDTTLRRLRLQFAEVFPIITDPPGARVYRRPVNQPDAAWELIGVTPLDSVALPRLGIDVSYGLRIEKDGYQTRDVLPNLFAPWGRWRRVDPIGALRLDPLGSADTAMVRIPGFRATDDLHPGSDSVTFADYFIGKREVTNREYKRFVDAGGYSRRELWTQPFVRDGRRLTFDEAVALFRDRTGLHGPATWSGGTYPDGQGDYPVGGVSWYEAAAYARFAGGRLPSAVHWFRATIRHGREASWLYVPTSNLNSTTPRRAGLGVVSAFGLLDVAGNVREWCMNALENGRVTRGAAWEDADFHVGHLIPKAEFDRSPSNGLRLVKVTDHDTTLAHVERGLTRVQPRDYSRVRIASDAEFAIYRRLYDYDPAPLDARVDTSGVDERFRWEKVSFTGPVPGERMAAYVLLPRGGRPPYQAVVAWLGSNALSNRAFDPRGLLHTGFFAYIPLNGRALVVPLLKGTFERDDSTFSIAGHPPSGSARERDLTILWHKEVRRTIDYLQSRTDIQGDRIGYYGFSWGARESPISLAIESRIRVAVLNVGGLELDTPPMPEMDYVHFLPRVRTPVLMLNGRHDVVFPYENSQLPFFRLLGTSEADKKHFVYPAGHLLPQTDQVRESLAWFDKYLGRP